MQLSSSVAVDNYQRVLLEDGCRSVDIECHTGRLAEPAVVARSGNLSPPCSFKAVVEVIKTYAFVRSELPVLIHLELKCDAPAQDYIREILLLVFGDALVFDALFDTPPLLSDLLGRFVVYASWEADDSVFELTQAPQPRQRDRDRDGGRRESGSGSGLDAYGALPSTLLGTRGGSTRRQTLSRIRSTRARNASKRVSQILDDAAAATDGGGAGAGSTGGSGGAAGGMVFKDLARIVMAGDGQDASVPLHTLEEHEAASIVLDAPGQLQLLSSERLVRIRPSAQRTGSDNMLPSLLWAEGCQLAPMNFQV